MLKHSDLPVLPEGQLVAAEATTEAWQAAHAPAITLKVWLGEEQGMVSIRWSPEIRDAPELAPQVMLLLMHTVIELWDAMTAGDRVREVLAAMDRES